ncbi:LLM class F420-dependent oxidoreductase [Rubrobacter xylanophilus]|uniref:LLM class F420-dependent oxidoreductase n=1 Tax=Rubrobacter xylanophilus TaxID=49319 RepID=A0A510HGJ3_9ACTN|nr:LLM class F420-dependent oxidoreductase [Rubrobacter xylanophilus]BBL78365.1 LLM class F420-dependent oxidoreductase [Rubrobacter xylanophilus]
MKLDVGLGVEGGYLRRVGDVARAAEELGFAGLVTSETKHDAFLPLAVAGSVTQRLQLLTSVAIAFSRSPMEMAQTAWDLQELSGGRLILGLGTQVRAHITRRFGMPWGRPVARLREYILALRAIWDAFQNDTPLDFEGEFYRHTLLTPFFNPGPIEHPEIPVYIAGVGERLSRLAGELCDGFHVHPFHSPEYVRRVVKPGIAAGAREAGRSPEEVHLATSVFVITGESRQEIEAQREAMRAQAAFYASTPTYRPVLEVHGWEMAGERLSELARRKRWEEMPRLITDEMLSAFAVEAPPDELGEALRERYEGLMERISLYMPFAPGERDRFWRRLVEALGG